MNEKRVTTALPLRAAIDTVSGQIAGALHVIGMLKDYLITDSETPGAPKTEVPENVLISAETTFIHACNRLDAILTDPVRWGLNPKHHIESAAEELIAAEVRVRAVQEEIVKLQARPAIAMRPALGQVGDDWVAVYGEAVGMGATPAEALESFDKVVINGLPKSEPEPTPIPVVKPARKKKTNGKK
jgi:hypothetical protein